MANLGNVDEIRLGVATALLELKDNGFFEGLDKASSALQNFEKDVNETSEVNNNLYDTSKMEKWADTTGRIGRSMTQNITLPVAQLGKSAVQAYRDTESAFTGVKKTIDENELAAKFGSVEAGYEALDKAIWQMTQDTASSYEEIAGVMEWAGQLGVPIGEAGEEIIGFTKAMVMMGDTTNISSSEAAESLAKFMNITGTSFKESENLGSAIVDLGNNFSTTEADIVRLATRLAGAGTQIGLSEAEILAFATSLSSVGITAEMGGSAF